MNIVMYLLILKKIVNDIRKLDIWLFKLLFKIFIF